MVLVLVMLPALAGSHSGTAGDAQSHGIVRTLVITFAQVGGFIAFMLIVGRRLFPWVLWHVAKTGSRELFTLCIVAAAVGIAFGSAAVFGVSFTLGAFFAGLVMRESEFSQRAASQTLPLQDAFSVLFFVSVGMLFDPQILVTQPLHVLATVAIIMLGKPLAAAALVLAYRYPVRTALTVSASLAQIGEFSFILAALGGALGVLPKDAQSLVLAGAAISIALNPVLFSALAPLDRRLLRHPGFARRRQPAESPLAELPSETEHRYLSNQIVLVGWGRVGKHIARALAEANIPFVVAEENREYVETLRSQGVPSVWGDATEAAVLIQAHIKTAVALVIATPETLHARKMIGTARALNPAIQVVVRSHNAEEAALIERDERGTVFVGESEVGELNDQAPVATGAMTA
jgi:monovalent cation:H+ antiporter-2, CPA2 family